MGYRFSLNNANAVGHLIEGDLITFLNQTLSSDSEFMPNIEFIQEFMKFEDFFVSENYDMSSEPDFYELKRRWYRFEERYVENIWNLRELLLSNINSEITGPYDDFLEILSAMNNILSRCHFKALLLPGFSYDDSINRELISEQLIKRLVRIHPGTSCLILQLKELPNDKGVLLLNTFKKFSQAFNKIEQWPGILLWKDDDSVFIPLTEVTQISEVFRILKYERNNAFNTIRKTFLEKSLLKRYTYIFHLSDLHFGNIDSNQRKTRLIRLLENHVSEMEYGSTVLPIITGDLVDSPNKINNQSYFDFRELLRAKGFIDPITILGNHDVDASGFLKFLTGQKAAITALSSPDKIVILPEINLAIIKFDSNTGGQLAQGEIGSTQLMNIGNEIDAIKNKDNLTFIALVHHHPKTIENPDWYERDWYEKILGNSGYESTMKLVDSELFLQWIEARGIKFILHGHKHIPKLQDHNGVKIIGAGSATGAVKHSDRNKTYMSYNIIKYDNDLRKPISCSIYVEEILGAGVQHVQLMPL